MNIPTVISIREEGALEFIHALLRTGVTVRMRVSGVSMLPLIRGGDVVEVAPLCEKKIRIGDIIFFCDQQGNPVVHRLHRRRYDSKVLYLQTKGDACVYYDVAVPAHQVLGRVERIINEQKNINLKKKYHYWLARILVVRTAIFFCLRRIRVRIINS